MSWQEIRGWSGFLPIYDQMVNEAQDGDTIVEIGVAFGRSLAYLARKVIDSGKKIRVVGVDPWRDESEKYHHIPYPGWGWEHHEWVKEQGGPFNAFTASMREHAREELELVDVIRASSAAAVGVLEKMPGTYRVRGVLIDGHHVYEDVCDEIESWGRLVVQGGILAGDDYDAGQFPGVVKAVDEAFGDRVKHNGGWWVRM